MQTFNIKGMSCAACVSRVEKAALSVRGVLSASASLVTNTLVTEGGDEKRIIDAVRQAGYGASPSDGKISFDSEKAKKLTVRLFFSLVLLLPLLLLSMGGMVGINIIADRTANGAVQLILALGCIAVNRQFFVSGFRGLFHGAPNMDILVSLGSGASFVFSTATLIFSLEGHLYFESAAMIPTLITVGKLLEAVSMKKTSDALRSLVSLMPDTAVRLKDGREEAVPAEEIKSGDILAIGPGESVPADGEVVDGISVVNESMLTGESVPVEKKTGSPLYAASINTGGRLIMRVNGTGGDTALSKMIKLVADASSSKAPVGRLADRIAAIFVPTVILLGLLCAVIWFLITKDIETALRYGISVLVVSCPCALGLATPVAITVGCGVGAKHGILFTSAEVLENIGKTETVLCDKTGTLTSGVLTVTDTVGDGRLPFIVSTLEKYSEHPIGRALREHYAGAEAGEITDFSALSGLGVSGVCGGNALLGGSMRLFEEKKIGLGDLSPKALELEKEGKTVLCFAENGTVCGIVALSDMVKEDSLTALNELKSEGLRVVMLTGDSEGPASFAAKELGISDYRSGLMPDGKAEAVNEFSSNSFCAMLGDGINDAPALALADVGVTMGCGTDIAAGVSGLILQKNSILDFARARRLSVRTLSVIRENLFWAFAYNIIGIPLAAGVFSSAGFSLSPVFCAVAMSLSSFIVVTNSLRINFTDLNRQIKIKNKTGRKKKMEITLNVEGMMCCHCEQHVKEALEKCPQVREAKADHESGTVTVTLKKEVPLEKLKNAIEKAGYRVL